MVKEAWEAAGQEVCGKYFHGNDNKTVTVRQEEKEVTQKQRSEYCEWRMATTLIMNRPKFFLPDRFT